jgi:hypothetical protein
MIPIKVLCGCGQKYSFEVEPINGRMPSTIACPVCGADGTAAANQIIAQTLASQPPPSLAPPPAMLRPAAAPPPAVAPPPPAATRPTAQDAIRRISQSAGGPGGPSDNWKWWYYVLAGLCIGGYSIWQAYNSQSIKPLGELFLAVFCIAIGIWDFNRKRKAKRAQG